MRNAVEGDEGRGSQRGRRGCSGGGRVFFTTEARRRWRGEERHGDPHGGFTEARVLLRFSSSVLPFSSRGGRGCRSVRAALKRPSRAVGGRGSLGSLVRTAERQPQVLL